jgi:hypothetical protein
MRDRGHRVADGCAGLAVALAALAASSSACDAPDGRQRPLLLTSADLAALVSSPSPPKAVAAGYGLPGGMRLDRIINQSGNDSVLAVRDTFTEGYRSAYVTTEVWGGFDEVWAQPMYIAVERYDADGTPHWRAGKSGVWRPVFGVGPDSAFYSPYWKMIGFEVPPGGDVDSFTSVRDVLDRGLDLRTLGGRVAPIVPATVKPPARVSAAGVPQVGGPDALTGWLDGEPVSFLDFGTETFTWDHAGVVEEAPLFVWVVRDDTGALRQLDLPTIAGSGPLYSHRPPKVAGPTGLVPKYGSYWRLYTIELPKNVGVFAPPQYQAVRDTLGAGLSSLYELAYDPVITKDVSTEYDGFAGRVLVTPSCVKVANDVTDLTAKTYCTYIDSQEAVETYVASDAIRRTGIVVTCPFVSYQGAAVVP